MTTALFRSLVTLAAVALPLGCGRDSVGAPTEILTPASVAKVEADNPLRFSDWSAPVNLGPVVNSAVTDIEVEISKDGLSLYLTSNRPGGFGGFDIWVSQRATVDDPWGPPLNLGPAINTTFNEQGADVTTDGHRMYFFSDRPEGLGGNDLYVARRRDKRDDFGWESPDNLGSGVNTAFSEQLPLHFEDDATGAITLYFNSNRPGGIGGATDIYASTQQPDGTFGPAVVVPELSSTHRDADPTIRRDGLELILASDRPGSIGGTGTFDLWVSTRSRTADLWSPPVNLGPVVNSVAGDSRVSLSFDATTLYFTSMRPGGSGNQDVWMTTRSKLRGPD